MDDLRYPIGRFVFSAHPTAASRAAEVEEIALAPERMRAAVADLSPAQLDTAYRPDGWTVCQVVHHLADSHINAYVRFRLALTEDEPLVRPYDEGAWARLPDASETGIGSSLTLLDALHERWVRLLRSLPATAMARPLRHPDHGLITVDFLLQMYSWHGRHHVAHVTALRARENW